jgi:phosphoribosylanthranilate isomerase
VPLDTLQFHGDETPIECSQYAMPFIKALRVHQDTDLIKMADDYHLSCGLLLQTHTIDKRWQCVDNFQGGFYLNMAW